MTELRASSDSLDELHQLTCEVIITQIRALKDRRLVNDDGEFVVLFPPALLAQSIKFLKDNGVDMPARKGNRVDTLRDEMPDFDNVVPLRK
jgi:hypothetical protein